AVSPEARLHETSSYTSKAGSSYGCATRSAETTSSCRSAGNTVSRRSSGTRSSTPRSPTAGSAPSVPKKVPVPSAYHEQRSYAPIRPAPAVNSASRTRASASGGTNTTSFRFTLSGRTGFASLRRRMLLRVDLRTLELAAVVDVDRLPLGEYVERRLPGLAVTVAGLLHAAEREVHLSARRSRVDVCDAGLQVAHRLERLVDVAREDRRREAVLHAVRGGDGLLERLDGDERGRRPEEPLLRDAHLRLDVREHGRPVVEAVALDALAAGEQLGAFVAADAGVRVDLLYGRLVDDRPDVRVVLPRRTYPHRLRTRDELGLELVVGAALHDHARCRGAALTCGPERRPDDAVDCEVEGGVVH